MTNGTWGRIQIRESLISPPLFRNPAISEETGAELYAWWSSERLQDQVPSGGAFGVALRCDRAENGCRVFSPVVSFDYFIAAAWIAGGAIRMVRDHLDDERCIHMRLRWFLFQRSRRMRQYIRRSFHSPSDLTIRQSGRRTESEYHLLPWGTEGVAAGFPSSVNGLVTWGRSAAVAAGVSEPTAQQCLHFGFVEAARQNPLQIPDDEIRALIRLVLFDIESNGDLIMPSTVDVIEARIQRALAPHLDAEIPISLFNEWFWGRSNTFIKQIARRGRNKIDPDIVRRVLLDCGWAAYLDVAECIDVVMRDFAEAMPEPLNATERLWFEHLLFRQPHLGGLPLALIGERLDFINNAIWDIGNSPGDQRQIQVLHRLLQYFASMVSPRREADRRTAISRPHTIIERLDSRLDSDQQLLSIEEHDEFCEVAARLRAVRELTCSCQAPDWHADLVSFDCETATIEFTCQRCQVNHTISASVSEFQSLTRDPE